MMDNILSLFKEPRNPEILFPLDGFKSLLIEMGWEPSDWLEHWRINNGENLATAFLAPETKIDWILGLCLPLLSDIKRSIIQAKKRRLFGISALPGCGKTTLGKWIEQAGKDLNISIKVISLDDFYLPSKELEIAMNENPWGVPRGLPGSHSISLLEESLDRWLQTGHLKAPKFDKALRDGLGDRSGWLESDADALVLEGWFLGCDPIKNSSNKDLHNDIPLPSITIEEINYRIKVQNILLNYIPIWRRIDRLWHIKAIDFSSTASWKIEQEKEMLRERGSALKGDSLISFIRMIQCSLPQESLMNIDADVVVEINKKRQVLSVALKEGRYS